MFWLDPNPDRNGEELAGPFQPRIEPGVEFNWAIPTILSDTQAVLSDGRAAIYRIGVRAEPKPHLASQAKTDMARPIASSPAALGDTLFAADAAGALTILALPGLAHSQDVALGSPWHGGPSRAGDGVLAATDDNQLFCLDAKGKRLWQVKLEHGALAGAPLRIGKAYVLASRSGIVSRIEAATGKELGSVDTGYPLAAGPVLCGQKLLVGGHDGTLYEVRQP